MQLKTAFPLQTVNTFRVEAVAERYVRFDAEAEISDYLNHHRLNRRRHLVLGGGSNLLFVVDFNGTILHPAFKGVTVVEKSRHHLKVKAMAGETWDDLVGLAVSNGWGGIENLSLIPGSVGASVVQNIGAYGVEVAAVIDQVEAIAISDGRKILFSPRECGFAYRTSNFKGPWQGSYIVTAVVFNLTRRPNFHLDYPGVKAAVDKLGRASLQTVRQAIVAIRQRKLPNPAEIGNAGSFFKNPVVDGNTLDRLADRFPDLPRYHQGGDRFKLPAGWLIERCGWKGRRLGRAAVHDRHALVLINLGGATGQEILELSEQIQGTVRDRFGIDLEREVQVIAQGS